MTNNQVMTKRTKRTVAQGAGMGLVGAIIGVPVLGVAIGVAHANKDKIKKFVKSFDGK